MGLSGRARADAHSRRPPGVAVPTPRLALIGLAGRAHAAATASSPAANRSSGSTVKTARQSRADQAGWA